MAVKRSKDTIAALLSEPDLAPPREPSRSATRAPRPLPRTPEVPQQEPAPPTPQPRSELETGARPTPKAEPEATRELDADTDPEWEDPDELEHFEFRADAPLVRPRRRKQVDYQTLRINRQTAKIMRQVWLANRRVDPALSYTEFATVVCQNGLRAMKEQRERGE